MKKSELALGSLMNSLGVLLYVAFVALVLSNGQRLFGESKAPVVPVFMMLLLVVSASVTGSLVLGKPILLYLDGRKKEAVAFFFATLGWLVCILLAVATVMMVR